METYKKSFSLKQLVISKSIAVNHQLQDICHSIIIFYTFTYSAEEEGEGEREREKHLLCSSSEVGLQSL